MTKQLPQPTLHDLRRVAVIYGMAATGLGDPHVFEEEGSQRSRGFLMMSCGAYVLPGHAFLCLVHPEGVETCFAS